MATANEFIAQQNALAAQAQTLLNQEDAALANGNLELAGQLHQQAGALVARVKNLDPQIATASSASSNTTADSVNVQNSLSPGESVVTAREQKNIASTGTPNTQLPAKTSTTTGANVDDQKTPSNNRISQATPSTNGVPTYTPTVNPLHNYPSYTYGLTLHALDSVGYKELINNPGNFKFTHTLISSASRYHATRDPHITDDFYFDDFKLDTVIAPNSGSKAGNSIGLSFTIVEPYGMTLLNRLIDFSNDTLTIENYLTVPYVLQIDFFGYDDSGSPSTAIAELKKLIPIKLTNMKMRASVKGTEYKIDAVPFNHQAGFYNTQSVKATIEVVAKTVGDYLNSSAGDAATTTSAQNAYYTTNPDAQRSGTGSSADPNNKLLASNQQAPANSQPVTQPDVAEIANNPLSSPGSTNKTSATPSTPTITSTSGFAAAYNAWFSAVAASGAIQVPDEIAFVVDDNIKSALVAIPKQVDARSSAPASTNVAGTNATATNNDPNKSKTTPAAQGDNLNTQVFTINYGTSIYSVVDMVITNSTYIIDQLKDAESQNSNSSSYSTAQNLSNAVQGKPVQWYRIIPKLELKDFDKLRNTWGKKITFFIKSYTYYNTNDYRAPISALPNPVKDYQFLYTGKNRDIVDFNIDFNTTFFNAIQVNKKPKETVSVSQNADNSGAPVTDKANNPSGKKSVDPVQQEPITNDARNNQSGSINKSETQNSTSYKDSIYSSQTNGDMLNLKLTIVGDPDFIKQDDVLFAPDSQGYKGNQQFVNGTNGSLVMDSGVIFCNVVFKTPSDINEQTGGLRYYGNENQSALSGLFRVMKVSSEMRQGKFTQVLDLIRQPNQPTKQSNTAPRSDSTLNGTQSKSDSPKIPGSILNDPSKSPQLNPLNSPKSVDEQAKTVAQSAQSLLSQLPGAIGTAFTNASTALSNIVSSGTTVQIDNTTQD